MAQVDEEAKLLTLASVDDAGDAWIPSIHAADYFVEILGIWPNGKVDVGQSVTVSLRVGNSKRDAVYRLTCVPKDDGTRIIGSSVMMVKGGGQAQVRFTRTHPGVGALAIGIEALQ